MRRLTAKLLRSVVDRLDPKPPSPLPADAPEPGPAPLLATSDATAVERDDLSPQAREEPQSVARVAQAVAGDAPPGEPQDEATGPLAEAVAAPPPPLPATPPSRPQVTVVISRLPGFTSQFPRPWGHGLAFQRPTLDRASGIPSYAPAVGPADVLPIVTFLRAPNVVPTPPGPPVPQGPADGNALAAKAASSRPVAFHPWQFTGPSVSFP